MKVEVLNTGVFVYGSTPAGIAAAVEASRRGCKVLLACPKTHLGGMPASGLCTTDAVRRNLFRGFVIEFISKVRLHYLKTLGKNHPDYKLTHDGWFYEPSVAEKIFKEFIEQEENLTWLPGFYLKKVTVEDRMIKEVVIHSEKGEEKIIKATVWVDATYEGDLAAYAGVPYRVGREGREEYGESLAGIIFWDWKNGKEIKTSISGEPSMAIQAYCARCIVTYDEKHRVPIEKPETYEQHLPDYLPLIDDFRTGRVKKLSQILPMCPLPNKKMEINGHIEALTSINCPGISWEYPEASYEVRRELDRFHTDHALGLMYFLQNDPHVPEDIRNEARIYGLHDEEFSDNGYMPWQIYVRQGRRIMGREIVTQHNFTVDPKIGRTPVVKHPVAIGEHSFDVHPCHDRRWLVDGFMEGVLWFPRKASGPAQPGQIPYEAMLPVNIDNLIVPVAISATHVAMSVIRMEPVWMTLGQVAGLASYISVEQKVPICDIDPSPLPEILGIIVDPYEVP